MQSLLQKEASQEQQTQVPVYWSIFSQCASALLKCKVPLLLRMVGILVGEKIAPADPDNSRSRPECVPNEIQDILVAVGNALIVKYVPQYRCSPATDNNNSNNIRLPARRARNEVDDESSNDEISNTNTPNNDNNNAAVVVVQLSPDQRRLCALALVAVMFSRCYEPQGRSAGFGSMTAAAIEELLTPDELDGLSLSSSICFLQRLHHIIHADRWTRTDAAITNSTRVADFIRDLLCALPSCTFLPRTQKKNENQQKSSNRSSADEATSPSRARNVVFAFKLKVGQLIPGISPSNSNNSNFDVSTTYTRGRILGSGESCRTFGCVDVDFYKSKKPKIRRTDCLSSFVVKVFLTKEGAEKERKIYDLVETKSVPGTTRIVRNTEINADAQNAQRMLVVTPRATHFRSTIAESHRAWLVRAKTNANDNLEVDPSITADHVGQLVDAVRSLHSAGIVHRDIQFQNLFCDSGDPTRALLNDFGRAALITDMRLCDFFDGTLRDWKMLESTLCGTKDERNVGVFNGRESWELFWKLEEKNKIIK